MRLWRFFALMLVGVLTPIFVYPIRDTLADWNRQSGAQLYLEEQAAPATIALIKSVRSELEKAPVQTILVNGEPVAVTAEGVPAVEDLSLRVEGATYTAEEVEAILQEYGSPAANQGLGELSVQLSQETGIDNSFWLWMFVQESGAGASESWAGRKPDGTTTANTGNIICAGYSSCYGRFRDYGGDWKLGTREHFKLLACYRDGGGEGCEGLWSGKSHTTIEEALNTWAPPSDGNNTSEYANFVMKQTQAARRAKRGEFVADGPEGEPQVAEPLVNFHPEGVVETSISFDDGPFGQNVRSVINSSPDLQNVSIPPGGTFSFNERWKINGDGQLTTYVVYGGGSCNVAGVYSNVARKLGLAPQFTHHGIKLNELPWEDAVSIWSSGVRGGQDLQIENTTNKTLRFTAELGDGKLTVRGWLE